MAFSPSYFYCLNKALVNGFLCHNMLPLATCFRFFLCYFVVSVFGAIIRHFIRYVSYIYRSLFNSESNSRIEADDGTRATDVASVLATQGDDESQPISVFASNSSKLQLEPTTQIRGFVEQSQTANCFVEELYCASPSSGNQIPDDLWELSSETEESDDGVKLEKFLEIFTVEQKDLKSSEDGTISEQAENFGLENENKNESLAEVQTLGEDCSFSLSDSDSESLSFNEEYIEIELEPQLHVSNAKVVLPVYDWSEEEIEDSFVEEPKETEWDEKKMEFEKEEDEFLQEHQDLINQLKMELRNSRTGGLSTVLEEEEEEAEPESICPTSVEAQKPLKNGGNLEHKEHFKEIHRVYKTCAEKMRKLDISNTQTNYAIGFAKLKDPICTIDGRKSGVKSLLSHTLRSGRAKKGCPKLMRDLKRDLEIVYVGHLCLSWEVLHWQHRKAIQLQQNDTRGTSQYSQVFNEFQLFCVLIERFIEDERFCGPRIEHYVKNRLLVHRLLQVPAIREDCVNDKKMRGKESESTISTAALVSIIEDAIRVFREFLQTDKDVRDSAIKSAQLKLHHTDIQNPLDAKLLMMEIRTDLRKLLFLKEKRLKDIMRSGNCIVKKLQRISEEGRLKNELLIAEVELRLVSRVVSMPRLTESQLIWCHKKLHQVNFVNRKVVIEPSFLLFPC